MATETVTVKLRNKRSGVVSNSITLNYTVADPTVLGWCPPNSTTTDMQTMLSKYPNPKAVRLYSAAGAGVQSWTGSLFSTVPRTATLFYSIKDWPSDIAAWLTARPATWTTPFYFCLDHEPEQQSGGDPLPADYRRQWQELINQLAGHPRRKEIRLCPVFTEYYAQRNSTWWNDFGIVSSYAGVDAVGFDVYDTGYSSYRTATERNSFSLGIARRTDVKKPLVYAEWGIARKTSDTDGTVAAQAMRDNIAYLRQQPDAPHVYWFYRGDCVLDTRIPEQNAFVSLMA